MKDHKSPFLNRALKENDDFLGMHGGVPKPPAGVRAGVPMRGDFDYTAEKPEKPRCIANSGECKAYPVKGERMCYGHLRKAASGS